MNSSPTFDERPLASHFPDPDVQHALRNGFAHQFLPAYVFQNPFAFHGYLFGAALPDRPMDPRRFIQSRWAAIFEEQFSLRGKRLPPPAPGTRRCISDLNLTLHQVLHRPVALVSMPPAPCAGENWLCAVMFELNSGKPDAVRARYFTLERMAADINSDASVGIICETTSDLRRRTYNLRTVIGPGAFLLGLERVLTDPTVTSMSRAEAPEVGRSSHVGTPVPSSPLLKPSAPPPPSYVPFRLRPEVGSSLPVNLDLLSRLDRAKPSDARDLFQLAFVLARDWQKNSREVVALVNLAAKLGHSEAQLALGDMLQHRDGAPRDVRAATRFYQMAAEQGSTEAQRRLAELGSNVASVSPGGSSTTAKKSFWRGFFPSPKSDKPL